MPCIHHLFVVNFDMSSMVWLVLLPRQLMLYINDKWCYIYNLKFETEDGMPQYLLFIPDQIEAHLVHASVR